MRTLQAVASAVEKSVRSPLETSLRTALLLALSLSLAACAGLPEQRPIPAGAPPLGKYTDDEIKAQAAALLSELAVGEDLKRNVLKSLEEYLAAPAARARIEAAGVNGVGAFQTGSGGFFFAGGGGNGIISFAGGAQKARFNVSGFSVGGTVGGGSSFGVVLVKGLDHEERFPDRYWVTMTGGEFADISYKLASGTAERGEHSIACIASGVGFGGSAARGSVTVAME
jgi:hypothetical protein